MAFEMIKINYSLWQKFHPKPRRLLSPLSLPSILVLSTPSCPTFPSLVMPRVPHLGYLVFLEASWNPLLLQHPTLVSSNPRFISTLLWGLTYLRMLAFLSLTLWIYLPWPEPEKGQWKLERGEVVPWQALGRITLGQIGSCPPWSQPLFANEGWKRPALLSVK